MYAGTSAFFCFLSCLFAGSGSWCLAPATTAALAPATTAAPLSSFLLRFGFSSFVFTYSYLGAVLFCAPVVSFVFAFFFGATAVSAASFRRRFVFEFEVGDSDDDDDDKSTEIRSATGFAFSVLATTADATTAALGAGDTCFDSASLSSYVYVYSSAGTVAGAASMARGRGAKLFLKVLAYHGWRDGCMHGRMSGWMDGWMEGWKDGWMHACM